MIALLKSGVSDSIMILKIKSSTVKFDTSGEAIIGLKNAGASDAVITAMLEKEATQREKP